MSCERPNEEQERYLAEVMIPWQIDVDEYREPLSALHQTIQAYGRLTVTGHRFPIEATRG